MRRPAQISVSKLGLKRKMPYFCAHEGAAIHILARLLVPEEEFWARLGKALGVEIALPKEDSSHDV